MVQIFFVFNFLYVSYNHKLFFFTPNDATKETTTQTNAVKVFFIYLILDFTCGLFCLVRLRNHFPMILVPHKKVKLNWNQSH